jgi:two-component system, NarL family, nitrate/nitrite response regulator NarL
MTIHLVLAGDHTRVLENLVPREPDFQVVARCQRGEEALHAVRQHGPDVLILDLCMLGKDGLEILREMRQEQLPTRVVLLTASLHDEAVLEAVLLGVGGVVLHEMTMPQLVGCLRKVYAGDPWLESGIVGRMVETMLRREVAARELALSLCHEAIASTD